jgi:hypothetical protein
MFGRAFLAIVLLICAGLGPAAAQSRETVETDISSRNIAIESTFTGASIVVFGTITRSRQTAPEAGLYDLAIVIRGPEQPVLIRRKSASSESGSTPSRGPTRMCRATMPFSPRVH